jgi:hypothetical protein
MKCRLYPLLLSGALCANAASPVDRPEVPECFKVLRLLKTDATHYWADWTNTCPYTIDSVYVMVGFVDGFRKYLGDGVWRMYFILPGAHRVTRFSVPVGVDGFESILVRRITTDSVEALSPPSAPPRVGLY